MRVTRTSICLGLLLLAAPAAAIAACEIQDVSVGSRHVLALRGDGSLWAWGANHSGALGSGSVGGVRPDARRVLGLRDVVSASAGFEHSLAVTSDGSVWAWGGNRGGQLGRPVANLDRPWKVEGLSDCIAVAAGWEHSLALKSDGTVWAWGRGVREMGFQDPLPPGLEWGVTLVPLQVPGLSGIVSLSTGWRHTLAIDSTGQVFAWGQNTDGMLGVAGVPAGVQIVAGLPPVMQVATGRRHSLALDTTGTVWAWGDGARGQLGSGTDSDSSTPMPVLLPGPVTQIAAGDIHSAALDDTGQVHVWGWGADGQIGDGRSRLRLSPTLPLAPPASALFAGGDVTLMLDAAGDLVGWGDEESAQLARGPSTGTITGPVVELPWAAPPTLIAAGGSASYAILTGGRAQSLGSNGYGELGDSTVDRSHSPVDTLTPPALVDLDGGWHHALAVGADGRVWGWGSNSVGQLGLGAIESTPTPIQVPVPPAIAVSGGHLFSLVLNADGTVRMFGNNQNGQAGGGSGELRVRSPVRVPGLFDIVDVAAGSAGALARESDGSLWQWGSLSGSVSPTRVRGGVSAIAAGSSHFLVLLDDGSLLTWGRNLVGQLGQGDRTDRTSPTPIVGLPTITAIACGQAHSLAVDVNGELWGWGENISAQLDGSLATRVDVPVRLHGLTDVVTPAAGNGHSLVQLTDGRVLGWGNGRNGEIGPDGSTWWSWPRSVATPLRGADVDVNDLLVTRMGADLVLDWTPLTDVLDYLVVSDDDPAFPSPAVRGTPLAPPHVEPWASAEPHFLVSGRCPP